MKAESLRRAVFPASVAAVVAICSLTPVMATEIRGSDGDTAVTPDDKRYWAFQPCDRSALPQVQDQGWSKTPLDLFILARLEGEGLHPVEPASRRELIRRVTFDLTGLPPTPDQVEAFVNDNEDDAYVKLVDRLLDSPHYGERWGRFWLDVARFAEDDVNGPAGASKYQNAWRYRDWVIQGLNTDMPYDLFVKAQIAGDLLDEEGSQHDLVAGTGFMALGVWYYGAGQAPQARADERWDRIDAITQGFLGLTVACARCHDHKYDPITMTDYYALDGIMSSTVYREYPSAPQEVVESVRKHRKKTESLEANLATFLDEQSKQVSAELAPKIAQYLMAAWRMDRDPTLDAKSAAEIEAIDAEILESWRAYLQSPEKNHPYLEAWNDLRAGDGTPESYRRVADEFQSLVLEVRAEKDVTDEKNAALLAAAKPEVDPETLVFLPNGFVAEKNLYINQIVLQPIERTRYILWLDIFGTKDETSSFMKEDYGLLRLQGENLERFLSAESKSHLQSLRTELDDLKNNSPPDYPYRHGMADSPKPADARIHQRGNPFSLGDVTPRRFLTVLSHAQPSPFTHGSGRRQLAEAIAAHPLTARVMANRIWQHHFGEGIVRTSNNFGRLGEAPTHPQLLEYLAHRFMTGGYAIKRLHREILLSATYQLSSRPITAIRIADENHQRYDACQRKDPGNRLLWRANRRRLDVESLRDTLLHVAGKLDRSVGGESIDLHSDQPRRTVYGFVSRSNLNHTLALFDFPNPSLTSQQRSITNVPLQRLFFLNSDFVWHRAGELAERLSGDDNLNEAHSESDSSSSSPAQRESEESDGRSIAESELPFSESTIRTVYHLLFGRDPLPEEIQLGLRFASQQQTGSSGEARVSQQYLQVLLGSNEFLYVD